MNIKKSKEDIARLKEIASELKVRFEIQHENGGKIKALKAERNAIAARYAEPTPTEVVCNE